MFDDYVSIAEGIRSDARTATIAYAGVTIGAVIAAAAIALLLARSISRRLSTISSEAHSIASDRLPEVLDALRNPSAEALLGALPTVTADASDEIGLMAESFNTVLRTSVETSIAHSQRRAKTLTNILVNLGRRNQALIDRQLHLIDQLESSQRDPQLLQGLFALDHMITTMRRNAENLLVLASEAPARAWTDPVPVLDVIRGAAAEVQDLSRIHIDVSASDNKPVLGGYAVDLSHLLAELVDNSISFSPPATAVQVTAERGPMSIRIWVLDKGLGMTEDEFADANERVANPPDVDDLSTDRVGFQVVGRLARRLGVQVRFQNNPGGGVAVNVTIPISLFAEADQDSAAQVAPQAPEERVLPTALVGAEAPTDPSVESAPTEFATTEFALAPNAEAASLAAPAAAQPTAPAEPPTPSRDRILAGAPQNHNWPTSEGIPSLVFVLFLDTPHVQIEARITPRTRCRRCSTAWSAKTIWSA